MLGVEPGSRPEYPLSYAAGRISLPKSHLDGILKKLAPAWYFGQIKQIREPDVSADSYITRRLAYCPKCMKENYHSVFHNMAGVCKCPLHHVKLVKVNASPNAMKIVFKPSSEGDIFNAHEGILPFERRVAPSVYQYVDYHRLEYILPISPLEKELYDIASLMLFEKQPDAVIPLSKTSISKKDLKEILAAKLRADHAPGKNLFSYDSTKFLSNELSVRNIGAEFLYLKVFHLYQKYVKSFDRTTYECIRSIEEGVNITKDDIKSLAICFIWSIIDTRDVFDAFTTDYIFKPGSYTFHYRYIQNPFYEGIFSTWCFDDSYDPNSPADLFVAFIKCINDCFNYLWDQFCSIADTAGGINSLSAWKLHKYPVYYLVRNEEGSRILRYDE